MNKLIDMHMHTFYSDGEYSPDEVVRLALKNNIGIMAITDHDTLNGVKNLDRNSQLIVDSGIEVYDGIELSAKVSHGRMHILGYDIDINNELLNESMEELKNNSTNTTISLIEQLKRDYNIRFTHEELKQLLNSNHNLGRIDIAKLLINNGYVSTVKDAFDKYLIEAYKKTYSTRTGKSYSECIELIKNAGGLAILAHPKSLELSDHDLVNLIKDMIKVGLDGIEVYHSSHSIDEMKFYLDIAEKYNLLISGGSDYHGPLVKPNVYMGTGTNNNLYVKQLSLVDEIKRRK